MFTSVFFHFLYLELNKQQLFSDAAGEFNRRFSLFCDKIELLQKWKLFSLIFIIYVPRYVEIKVSLFMQSYDSVLFCSNLF